MQLDNGREPADDRLIAPPPPPSPRLQKDEVVRQEQVDKKTALNIFATEISTQGGRGRRHAWT